MAGNGSPTGRVRDGLLLPFGIIAAGSSYFLWRFCRHTAGHGAAGYVLFAALVVAFIGTFAVVGRWLRRSRPGAAGRDASARAIAARAAHLRPDLGARAGTADAAIRLGLAGSTSVHATVEDGSLVVGPARSGKTRGLMAGA